MKTLKLILTILALLTISTGCGGGGGGGGIASVADTTAPKVEAFYPDPATDGDVSSTDIQTNGIKVIFDEGMDSATIASASFTVEEWTAGGTAVTGTVTYDSNVRTAKFVPDNALKTSWDYVVTVSTGVTDSSGNNLAADYTETIMVAPAALPGPVP